MHFMAIQTIYQNINMNNALLKILLQCTVILTSICMALGQDAENASTDSLDMKYERPFLDDTWFSFEFSSSDGLDSYLPGMAVKETSETPSSSLELETDSELGELQSDYPEESPYEVMTIATTSVDVETETIMVTVYMDSGIPTVTVTEVVTDTWSSGNADQSFTIPAQLQAPVIVTVTQTSTSYISDTINLPTSVTVVSVTDVVTETASPTTPPPITMTETTTEYTTETVTMSTTLAPLTDMETVMETSTDVDVVYTSVISTSYDIQTRTFTLANGFLSYKVGFSEELWAPTYTQTTTMVTNVYITSVIVV